MPLLRLITASNTWLEALSSKFRHTQGQNPCSQACNLLRTKPLAGKQPLASCEDTNCADHELLPHLLRGGEQNPWIPQTLRFTHIHNEKQPTDNPLRTSGSKTGQLNFDRSLITDAPLRACDAHDDLNLVEANGFEPMTSCLQSRRSTN